jgi:membrane protein YdbS with pleckstrin-like domain
MLSEKEKQFLLYWEAERDKQNTVSSKILNGLPMAIIFSLPVFLAIFAVYFLFPDWYTKISNTSSGTFVTVFIAVLLCIFFFSYFRMHYKWEMNEQLYHELKKRQNKIDKLAD